MGIRVIVNFYYPVGSLPRPKGRYETSRRRARPRGTFSRSDRPRDGRAPEQRDRPLAFLALLVLRGISLLQ